MATSRGRGRGRKRKNSPSSSLEASLERLQEVSSSLKKTNPRRKSDFVYSLDGSGTRGPSKYKYRSVVERAGSSSKGRNSSHDCNNTGDISTLDDVGHTEECDFTDLMNDTSTLDRASSNLETLDDCIAVCEELTEEIKSSAQSTWAKRMQSVESAWEGSRATIFKALLECHAIPSSDALCFICGCKTAVIRCHQCGPRVLMCSSCDAELHEKKPLHDRDVWTNGFFQEIPPTTTVLGDGSLGFTKRCAPFLLCEACLLCKRQGTLELVLSGTESCIVITCEGRFDLFLCSYYCNGCDEHFSPVTLEKIIMEGYWPGSPKQFNHVFSEQLFRLWDSVRKHMPGTSETAFLRSLGNISSERGRSSTINVAVFHRAFKEWCFAMHELEAMKGKNWIDCPSCYKSQHSCHVDGNAKLYRYSCVPRGERKCYYGNLFVEERDVVDAHLKNVYDSPASRKSSGNSYCGTSNWKAAKNSAHKRTKLDETGIDVAGCRHALAVGAVNMYQGELFGYTHYLQVNRLVPRGVQFLWQDVICKYWPWFTSLPKDLSPPDAFCMKPALSIMHGKGHVWSCQVTWGGRWQEGSAYTTGEEVEQINGYISRLGSTTKYMNAAGREETLTEHVLHWNKQKVLKLARSLSKKFVNVQKLIDLNEQELKKEIEEMECGDKIESAVLEEWRNEIAACGRRSQFKKDSSTKFQKDLMLYYQLSMEIIEAKSLKPFVEKTRDGVGAALVTGNSDMFKEALEKQEAMEDKEKRINKLESGLGILGMEYVEKRTKALEEGKRLLASEKRQTIRVEIEMLSFSISQRTKNISRLADSSKQRSRLRSKNANEKKKLEELVKQYNFVNDMLEESENAVIYAQALAGSFPWIDEEDDRVVLPLRAKRKAVEIYLTGKRLGEELSLLKKEMVQFLSYYKDSVIPDLSTRLNSLNKDDLPDDDVVPCSTDDVGKGKYISRRLSRFSMEGENAVIKSGIFFCKTMIKEGATLFKSVLDGSFANLDIDDSEDEDGDEEIEDDSDDSDVEIEESVE